MLLPEARFSIVSFFLFISYWLGISCHRAPPRRLATRSRLESSDCSGSELNTVGISGLTRQYFSMLSHKTRLTEYWQEKRASHPVSSPRTVI